MTAGVVIETRSLTYTYPTGRTVDIGTVEIPSTGMTRLLGANGFGKSTLLQLCRGDLRGYQGSLRVFGREVREMSSGELRQFRRQIAFIKQSPYLEPDDTVQQSLHRALTDAGVSSEDRDRLIPVALARVGLLDLADEYPEHLSGGQRQRIPIAEAIARGAQLILADEPLRHLDVQHQLEVLETLEELSKSVPVVIVEHDRNEVSKYCANQVELKEPHAMSSPRGPSDSHGRVPVSSFLIGGACAGVVLYVLLLVLGLPSAGGGGGASSSAPVALVSGSPESSTASRSPATSLSPSTSSAIPDPTTPPPSAEPSECPSSANVAWSGDNTSRTETVATPTDKCTTFMISSGSIFLNGDRICHSDGTINCVLVWRSDESQPAQPIGVDANHNWWSTTSASPKQAIEAKLSQLLAKPNCGSGCASATIVVYTNGKYASTQIRN